MDPKKDGAICDVVKSYLLFPSHLGTQVALDVCFKQNLQGTKDAYCRKSSYGYQGCAPRYGAPLSDMQGNSWGPLGHSADSFVVPRDMKCGKIFCSGGSEFPITHQKATITLGPRVQCKIAMDNSDGEDLGMVPTGTKCGDKKVSEFSILHVRFVTGS